jgi:arylsulfatase A-like enzyme
MRQISAFFFLSVLLFFTPFCRHNNPSGFQIERLIDSFNEESIERSPFIHLSETAENIKDFFPVKSFPINEMGVDVNPFFLKRKIKVGRELLNSLYAPPESRYDFQLEVTDSSTLEFGFGIIRDENFQKINKSGLGEAGVPNEVQFAILLESSGEERTLFQESLQLPSLEEGQAFLLNSIDLSSYKGKVRLSLITTGEGNSFSFWFNPVLYPKGKSRRQVILISVDTLRADHLSCYGYERPTSPYLDALATESALFVNVYAPSPWTLPSHVSMLTGLNTVRHQVNREDQRMNPELITLAELLKTNNFFCSAFTGGGFVSSAFGFADGFDSYYERADEIYLDHAAELCFRDVARWIEFNKDRDFFLFIHTYQPHDPYVSPLPYKTRFLSEQARWTHLNLMGYLGGKSGIFNPLSQEERQNIIDLYDGEILYTDEGLIGPLLATLKEMSLFDQTMIIFTSDHGEEFFDHHGWGHGHSLYDELLKVPLLIKFPDKKFRGRRIENIVSLVDIVPTVLDEFRIGWSKSNIDGRSLVPLLTGKEKEHRTFLADVGENILNLHLPRKMAMNEGTFKFIVNKYLSQEEKDFFQFPPVPVKMLELFDLSVDPLERNSIVEKEARLAQRFLRHLEAVSARVKGQIQETAVIDKELEQQLRALGYIK